MGWIFQKEATAVFLAAVAMFVPLAVLHLDHCECSTKKTNKRQIQRQRHLSKTEMAGELVDIPVPCFQLDETFDEEEEKGNLSK